MVTTKVLRFKNTFEGQQNLRTFESWNVCHITNNYYKMYITLRPLCTAVVPASSPVAVPSAEVSELSQCHSEPSLEHVKRCDGWEG